MDKKIVNIESQNIEFKEAWRDEYQKWICGFANAQGGTLYIGLCDNAFHLLGLLKLLKDFHLRLLQLKQLIR